jgi:mono/diheme cytochrome c family protein
MKSDIFKRLSLLAGVAVLVIALIMMFTYNLIKIDWVDFMKIQPAFQPMSDPLPIPADSIPIDGSVYVPSQGVPTNPVNADPASIARGSELFNVNCSHCHGLQAKGNGPVAVYLQNKPADLTSLPVQALSDGGIFLTISQGIQGKMPALNENLTVRERWDVVNYIRTLK